MFKAILREALQSKCHRVSLIEGKMVSFEGNKGENQRQAYGTLKARCSKKTFNKLRLEKPVLEGLVYKELEKFP